MAEEPTVSSSLVSDRISNLPSSVANNILKCLSLPDVVRTSILSRHWRYKWTTLTDLDFDYYFERLVSGKWKLDSIIDRILQRHKGSIVKFPVEDIGIQSIHPIICWLHFLINHEIEYLKLHLSIMSPETDDKLLPSDLFTLNHLKQLHLHNFKMMLPPAFEGFSKLVHLDLKFVNIEFKELKIILSRCPMLEFLGMFRCADISKTSTWLLDIDAPNLKTFHFEGYFSSICFRNANLEEISFSYRGSNDSCGSKSNMIKVFNQLLSIKKVQIGLCDTLEFLATGGIPQKLPNNLNHLTYLNIQEIELCLMDHATCVLCLIRSSPNLHTLKIDAPHICNFRLSRLEIVEIYAISGYVAELEFVKLLSMWATALEKLVINPYFKVENDVDTEVRDEHKRMLRGHKLLKEIVSFRRALSEAVILFPCVDDVMYPHGYDDD